VSRGAGTMRRMAIAMTLVAMAAVPAATASAEDPTLDNYSNTRDQLKQCNMDLNWNQLSESKREDCDQLFGKFVLWADTSQEETYYLHCRSASNCIPTPDGFPDAAGPIPQGAYV